LGQVNFSDLGKKMAAEPSASERLQLLVSAMGETFDLPQEDVTVMAEGNGVLIFRHPKALAKSTVPITAKSIAGQTFQQNKVYVFNNLSEIQHVELFEQFVPKEGGALPIQRMISCPIPGKSGPRGVLQVCRKGKIRDSVAPFSRSDTDTIISLARVAGQHLLR
jgi:hypothetical protein